MLWPPTAAPSPSISRYAITVAFIQLIRVFCKTNQNSRGIPRMGRDGVSLLINPPKSNRGWSNHRPSRWRGLAGMNGPAPLAFARRLVAVEGLVERRQILHQMLDLHFDAMNECAAFETIPLERIELSGPSRLHHQADRALRPLRRMAHMRRQQKYIALKDRHVIELPVIDHLEHHVAFELVKELLNRIVMVIGALVRAADDLHGHLAVLEDLLVADRRLEQMLVLADPA